MDHPKIREQVIAEPVQQDGRQFFLIRDLIIFKDQHLVVNPLGVMILGMLDGTRSIVDIQAELARRSGGQIIPSEPIRELIRSLDEELLLDNERFQAELDRMMKAFRDAPARPSTCFGDADAWDPEELSKRVRGYYEPPEGPGLPDHENTGKAIKGVVAPHIDYDRGGHCYAHAYRELMAAPPVDLFLILGTAHEGTGAPFIFSKKDFETPLGVVKTDTGFIERLEGKLGRDLCKDEFVHIREHSVELQLVFMQLAYENRGGPEVVPILCGGFHQQMLSGKRPTDDPDVAAFLAALKETINETDKRVCVMASADLSHMGPQFGDDEEVTDEYLKRIEAADLETLEVVLTRDPDDLFRQVQEDQNRRRLCGLASIYTTLSVIESEQAELLKYGLTTQPTGNLVVSFCSMIFR